MGVGSAAPSRLSPWCNECGGSQEPGLWLTAEKLPIRIGASRMAATVSLAQEFAQPLITFSDELCRAHLDDEYAALARALLLKLARKRPTPLVRGRSAIWVGAVLSAIGQFSHMLVCDPRHGNAPPRPFGRSSNAQVQLSSRTIQAEFLSSGYNPTLLFHYRHALKTNYLLQFQSGIQGHQDSSRYNPTTTPLRLLRPRRGCISRRRPGSPRDLST